MNMNQDEYRKKCVKYLDFGKNLELSLAASLRKHGIKYHAIQMRIKKWKSLSDKISSKMYEDENEVEDICGLRIICFYLEDIKRISDIIEREFTVVNSIDKETELDSTSFGYRSKHYVVTIKDDWMKTPNYQDCGGLKAEIQIRTILMHSWAEIEHNLSYKSKNNPPQRIARQFSRLSALIELADEQFEQIKELKQRYIEEITPQEGRKFNLKQELNVDSLQAFLDTYLAGKNKSQSAVSDLLAELLVLKLSFQDILTAYENAQPFLTKAIQMVSNTHEDEWVQVGVIRLSLDLINDKYWQWRLSNSHPFSVEITQLREEIKQFYVTKSNSN